MMDVSRCKPETCLFQRRGIVTALHWSWKEEAAAGDTNADTDGGGPQKA
jgi:hypothetical protein